jgi:hypothetical protein
MARVAPPPTPPEATFFRAEPTSGPDGGVEWWGDPLTDAEATARLQHGGDVVVRGSSRHDNRSLAMALLDKVFGGYEEDQPHEGPMSLPHLHPRGRAPPVHVFFDSLPAGPYARRRKPPKPKKRTP